MALRERYIKDSNGAGEGTALAAEETVYGNQSFQEMKAGLHRAIIARLDLAKLSLLPADRVHAEVSRLAESLSDGRECSVIYCRARPSRQ